MIFDRIVISNQNVIYLSFLITVSTIYISIFVLNINHIFLLYEFDCFTFFGKFFSDAEQKEYVTLHSNSKRTRVVFENQTSGEGIYNWSITLNKLLCQHETTL